MLEQPVPGVEGIDAVVAVVVRGEPTAAEAGHPGQEEPVEHGIARGQVLDGDAIGEDRHPVPANEVAVAAFLDHVADDPKLPKILLLSYQVADGPVAAVLDAAIARRGGRTARFDAHQRALLAPYRSKDDVRDKLAAQVVGQPEAAEALADVVSVAKARLNDPGRPLAAFLFVGPTGVGKTEAAKAAARVLFGTADRLIRFDLNEFNQPGAAARLEESWAHPSHRRLARVRRAALRGDQAAGWPWRSLRGRVRGCEVLRHHAKTR